MSTRHLTRGKTQSVRTDEDKPKPWSMHSSYNEKILLTAFVHYSAADLWPTSAPVLGDASTGIQNELKRAPLAETTLEALLQHK